MWRNDCQTCVDYVYCGMCSDSVFSLPTFFVFCMNCMQREKKKKKSDYVFFFYLSNCLNVFKFILKIFSVACLLALAHTHI